MVQLKPGLFGRGSVTVTLNALPAPLFVTAIVKPIGVGAVTVLASAVLVIWAFGHCTVVDACVDVTGAWLSASAVAVLLYVPQVAALVGLETCTVAL